MFKIVAPLTMVHAVRDVGVADRWYAAVLNSDRLFNMQHESAKGSASRHAVGNLTVEPIASDEPTSNIHRVCARYGERLYSNAWLTDDLVACAEHLQRKGIRLYRTDGSPLTGSPGDDAFFTHPQDTHGTLEFASAGKHANRSVAPTTAQGSVIRRASRLIWLVPDAAKVASTYEEGLLAHRVGEEQRANEYRSVVVRLGTGDEIELREPWPGGSALAGIMGRRGEGPYSVRFEVSDLDGMHTHLARNGVASAIAQGMIVTDAADCHGIALEFVGG